MNWIKKGLIFQVNNTNDYLLTHASNPLAVHLQDNIFRVFYSGRNKLNKSSVGYVDIDIIKQKLIVTCSKPLLTYGEQDSFYSHGVSIGNMYKDEKGKDSILFMGWQIPDGSHWRGDIGKVVVTNNISLELDPIKAFMSVDDEDKISLSYPWVEFHEGKHKMWYGSTIDWTSVNGEMIHVIKYATSDDGVNWEKHGVAIPYELGIAQAFSRPSVIIDKNGYHMWFSYRDGKGTKYRIGYSHSLDGIIWTNKLDEVGIDVSQNGWDSEMICYPFVFDHMGKRFMLYNGNDYGKQGFGLAELEK